mmetsp:Transcript_116731/g.326538  ORF Transcript_116731/g.326538 Transcript_116731/m.326538 type:complete len:403 (-) Transcript_116731:297-1505(-)
MGRQRSERRKRNPRSIRGVLQLVDLLVCHLGHLEERRHPIVDDFLVLLLRHGIVLPEAVLLGQRLGRGAVGLRGHLDEVRRVAVQERHRLGVGQGPADAHRAAAGHLQERLRHLPRLLQLPLLVVPRLEVGVQVVRRRDLEGEGELVALDLPGVVQACPWRGVAHLLAGRAVGAPAMVLVQGLQHLHHRLPVPRLQLVPAPRPRHVHAPRAAVDRKERRRVGVLHKLLHDLGLELAEGMRAWVGVGEVVRRLGVPPHVVVAVQVDTVRIGPQAEVALLDLSPRPRVRVQHQGELVVLQKALRRELRAALALTAQGLQHAQARLGGDELPAMLAEHDEDPVRGVRLVGLDRNGVDGHLPVLVALHRRTPAAPLGGLPRLGGELVRGVEPRGRRLHGAQLLGLT